MQPTFVQVIASDYEMRLIEGSEPEIQIMMGKKAEPSILKMVKEMLSVDHRTNIEISTDTLTEKDNGQLSIVVNICAEKTPALLERLSETGALMELTRKNRVKGLCSIYTASSRQMPYVADRFFRMCAARVAAGHKIPIIVWDARDFRVASFETDNVTRFAWAKMMAELRQAESRKSAN